MALTIRIRAPEIESLLSDISKTLVSVNNKIDNLSQSVSSIDTRVDGLAETMASIYTVALDTSKTLTGIAETLNKLLVEDDADQAVRLDIIPGTPREQS